MEMEVEMEKGVLGGSRQPVDKGLRIAALIALLFGLVTLKAGGSVLFFDGPARVAAGDYLPLVLWFNFIAGFFYIAAAAGLWLQRRWSAYLSLLICAATLAIFLLFGLHVLTGGSFEARTVGAMTLRSTFWGVVGLFSYYRIFERRQPPSVMTE